MGYRVSRGDENVLKLALMVAQLCKYTKKLLSSTFLTSEFRGM